MTLQDGGIRTGCQVREFVIDFPVGEDVEVSSDGIWNQGGESGG